MGETVDVLVIGNVDPCRGEPATVLMPIHSWQLGFRQARWGSINTHLRGA